MSYTLQLNPKNDQDIIEFLNEQPNKQAAIKDALRACIHGGTQQTDIDLQAMFREMRAHIDQQFLETKSLLRKMPVRTDTESPPRPSLALDDGMKANIRKAFKPGR